MKRSIYQLVVVEDAFGLRADDFVPDFLQDGFATFNERWRFRTTPEKVREFQSWLREELAEQGLTDRAVLERYVQDGARRGAGRAFTDVNSGMAAEDLDFYRGSRDDFLRSAFSRPVAAEKVELLVGRAFTDLQGINEAMATGITRTLSDGLVQGLSPRDVARQLANNVDGIGIRRARNLAQTETIRAHAEGQLLAFEQLGVEKIGVAAEWSTAGDDRVCPLCQALEGVIMTVKEARGLIPRHVGCRCTWIPNTGEDGKRSQKQILLSIEKSLRLESRKAKTVAEARKRSRWQGADKKIKKNRPKVKV